MSSDDRLGARLRRLAADVRPDPGAALEGTLSRGRRHRRRRLVGEALAGVLASAGIALAVAGLVQLAPLGGERPAAGPSPSLGVSPGPATASRPECISLNVFGGPTPLSDAPTVCGLLPRSRRVEGGTAHRLRTPAGHVMWLVLPDEARVSTVLAFPSTLPIVEGVSPFNAPLADFSTAPAEDMAFQACLAHPGCDRRRDLVGSFDVGSDVGSPNHVRWRIRGGEWLIDTVEMEGWTLSLTGGGAEDPEQDLALVERVARAATWTLEDDGFILLTSSEPGVSFPPDWSSVNLWIISNVGAHSGRILPGCDLSAKDPDLGGNPQGPGFSFAQGKDDRPGGSVRWCEYGYLVDLDRVERDEARRFYEGLRVLPRLGA